MINIPRPGRDETLMAVAKVYALRSTCNRLHVGAVLAMSGRIISTGYNGPPSNLNHCDHQRDDPTPCSEAVHAEANAIAFAARHGLRTEHSTLYVTNQPCLGCAKLIINAGIRRVVYQYEYRDKSGVRLLFEANINCHPLEEGS